MRLTQTTYFFILLNFLSHIGSAQTSGISPVYSFDIRKKIEPPILQFSAEPVFIDEDGNNAINAYESCKVLFTLKNIGKGDALNLKTVIKAIGSISDVSFLSSQPIPKVVKLGGTTTFSIIIKGGPKTVDGNIEFKIEVEEPNGFNSDEINIVVATRKFIAPKVRIVDYVIFSGSNDSYLELKKPFSLQLLVQNLGPGVAKQTQLKFIVPTNVFLTGGDEIVQLKDLAPGEKSSIIYELIANSRYDKSEIILNAELTESCKIYGENWSRSFALNQSLSQRQIEIKSKAAEIVEIEAASLRSDVDKDIPIGLQLNNKKYALIIGCENYSKYQSGLEKEVDAEFAANDARVFSEYAVKTLGFPKEQVYLLIDATSSQIRQNIFKLMKSIEIEKNQAEVLFYYSGHGLPDEETKLPYLIPVDVNGNNPKEGISLTDLYSNLTKFESKKITVVLDACFSGGARNKEMLALKGVKIKPRIDAVPSNLVVFSSSKGAQSSGIYKDKHHGYFTYFLLKNIKENHGKMPFGDFYDELKYRVEKEAIKTGKLQTPDINPGLILGENWKFLTW